MTDKVIVYCACGTDEEAARIARELVAARLAACVNVVPGVRSFYEWRGKLEEASEFLLVIKSSAALLPELTAAIRGSHSYEVPEVIAVPIAAASRPYLAWMDGNLRD